MMQTVSATVDAAALLTRVQHMLDDGQAAKALGLLEDRGQNVPAIRNAKGVCHLRLGRLREATAIFRDLVFPDGAFTIPEETPTVFRANYVTALLLQDNLVIGVQLLGEIPEKRHPLVEQLKAAVRRWKQSLPWWRRWLILIGVYPSVPLRLDFVPGSLWGPQSEESPRPMERAA